MMRIPRINTCNDRHRRSWLSAGSDACVSTRISCPKNLQKHFAAPQTAPAARPNLEPNASVSAKLKALPTLCITYAPEPASKML